MRGRLVIQPEISSMSLGTIFLEYDNSRKDHIKIETGEGEAGIVCTSVADNNGYYFLYTAKLQQLVGEMLLTKNNWLTVLLLTRLISFFESDKATICLVS